MTSRVDQYIVYIGNKPRSVWAYREQACESALRLAHDTKKAARVIKHTTRGETFLIHTARPQKP